MKKVLILSALLVVALSVTASAAYLINWTDTFESRTLGSLAGQDGWVAPDGSYADTDMNVTTVQNHTPGGSKAAEQITSTTLYSSAANDSRLLNKTHVAYKAGLVKFWVWEPGTVGDTTAGPNFRVGVYGTAGIGGGAGIGNNMFTANLQTTNKFWRAQWSSDPRVMDGTVSASAATYKWTPMRAAPRKDVAGWSYVMIKWGFDLYDTGTGFAEWYVNSGSAALRLEFNSIAAAAGNRWIATTPILGVFVGDATVKNQLDGKQGFVDDIEFHGDPVPEPGSLMVIGTGLAGLVGLIRRKR